MDFIKNTKGITGDLFEIGDVLLTNNSGSLDITNSSGSVYLPIKGGRVPSSSSYDNLTTLINLYGFLPLIEFSFSGNAVPSTGSYINKFGICYSSGSSYVSSGIYYDTGEEFLEINTIKHIATSDEIKLGDLSLDENTIYSRQGNSWVAKGSAGKGTPQVIRVPYSWENVISQSENNVPSTAYILNTINDIEEAFNGSGANLEVYVSGSINTTLMGTSISNLITTNQYIVDDIIKVASEGVVTINVYPSGSVYGSGSVYVQYVIPRT